MLGAWIDCAGAWTGSPNHAEQDLEGNRAEIDRAVALAQQYPDIIKVIAVGNEAMVHWAASYFVAPSVILQWVNHLQDLKSQGTLPADQWITSSDNFASWGGGGAEYHNPDLEALVKAGLRVPPPIPSTTPTTTRSSGHPIPSVWIRPPSSAKWSAPWPAPSPTARTSMLRSWPT